MLKCYSLIGEERSYHDLIDCIQYCDLCERLCNTSKKIPPIIGDIKSKVLLIDEFPSQDSNLEMLLNNVGWREDDFCLTHALMCSQKDDDEATPYEIENCSIYLNMIINLIKPNVIISLGSLASKALNHITHCEINLPEDVGKRITWDNIILIPLYNPHKNTILHRSLSKQRADFITLSKFIDPRIGVKRLKTKSQNTNFDETSFRSLIEIIYTVVSSLKQVTYFKLMKLLYLIDLAALEKLGETATGKLYLRQQEGPWSPDIQKTICEMNNFEIQYYHSKIPVVRVGKSPRVDKISNEKYMNIINDVLNKYGQLDNTKIKIAAYRSKPMQYVLKQEKLNRDMRKKPLIYKNKTIIDLENEN